MPNYKATGRPPSKNPRRNILTVKITDDEKERLEKAAAILTITKTRLVVEGINRMFNEAAATDWKRQQNRIEPTTPKRIDGRKLPPEELERMKTDFDPPAWADKGKEAGRK